MVFLLSLFLNLKVFGAEAEWFVLPRTLPLYARASDEAAILATGQAGERVAVRQKGNTYWRVQFKRGGKWKLGFIATSDLKDRSPSRPRGSFGFGLGGAYSYLRHGQKSFETDDQVRYTTDNFVSQTVVPSLLIQYGERSFWRLILAYRKTDYSSKAITDVPGATSRDLSLQHSMISASLQKMWTPLGTPRFYWGLGLESAMATEAKLVLGGLKVPVESKDLPTYVGANGVLGGQFDIHRQLSAFAELRLGSYFNQSPYILSAEAVLGLMLWP